MIFPFILLIADICLWWLVQQIALLNEPLLTIAVFGLAFGLFIWVIMEGLALINANPSSSDDD